MCVVNISIGDLKLKHSSDVHIMEATHSRLTDIIQQGEEQMLLYRESISRNSDAPPAKKLRITPYEKRPLLNDLFTLNYSYHMQNVFNTIFTDHMRLFLPK